MPLLAAAIPLLLAAGCMLLRPGSTTRAAYVGSDACISCHESRHPQIVRAWRGSRHHATMQRVDADGLRPQLGSDCAANGERLLAVIGRPGGRHVLVRPDLRIVPSRGWEEDELFPPHDVIAAPRNSVDAGEQCLGCHSTGYFVAQRACVEPGVGCEACHGPGRRHAETGGSKERIVNPARLPRARGNMVCGQCHSAGADRSGKHPFPVVRAGSSLAPFRPGQDLATGFVDARPKLARKGWEYSSFAQASEAYSNQSCTDCHDPHGRPAHPSMLKDPTNEICLRCHGVGRARLRFQNHGAVGDVTKKTCWACHRNAHAH